MLVFVVAVAWAGFNPAQAAVCGPLFGGEGYARGDALLAYASLLQAGGIDLALSGGNIDHLIADLRDSVDEKDIYGVDWRAKFNLGCDATGSDEDVQWSFKLHYGMDGLFVFTPGLFDMVGGTSNAVDFMISNDMATRRGVTIQADSLVGNKQSETLPAFRGGLILDVWEMVDFEGMMVEFHRPQGSSHMKLTQSLYKKPTPGQWTPPNTRPFAGGGYSVGLLLNWKMTDKIGLTYTIDSVFGQEWADGMIHQTTTINTDKQYIGVDGYLKELPLAVGTIRKHSFRHTPSPIHRLEADIGWILPINIGAAYDTGDQTLKDMSIATKLKLKRTTIGFGYEAEDATVTGSLLFPITIRKTDLLFDFNVRTDSFVPRHISAIGMSGGITLRF